MKAIRFSVAQAFYVLSKLFQGQFTTFSLATVLALLLAFEASAQLQVGASEAGIQVQGLTAGVPAGVVGSFEVDFDDVNVPIENVVGFQLELELDPGLDSLIQLRFAGSCIPAADQSEVSWAYNAGNHTISISLQGATSFSGEGRLFMLDVFTPTGIAIHDSMVRLGGGFILVEDIGFKRAAIDVAPANLTSIFPNPSNGAVNVRWNAEVFETLIVLDNAGQEVYREEGNSWQDATLTNIRLPRGSYQLVLQAQSYRESHAVLVQ